MPLRLYSRLVLPRLSPMNRLESQRQNHPKPGASIKVEPVLTLDFIAKIKANLADHPRNLCLFTMGINTAYRASDLLSLRVGQVQHLQAGDRLDLKQPKNKEYRAVTLNQTVVNVLANWLAVHPLPNDDAPLFLSE